MKIDVLAFGPHPDDVELFVGGTLLRLAAQGHSTAIIDLTAGEMGTRGTQEQRKKEADEAAKILGVASRRCLDLGDGRLAADWPSKVAVAEAIRELKPRLVITNYWESNHPDHTVSGRLVAEAAYLAGLAKLEAGGEPHRPNRVLYYFLPYRVAPSFVVDISEHYEKKLQAIEAYRSQFHDPSSREPKTFISHPDFLTRMEGRDRYFGSLIDVNLAEAFFVREAMRVDDPVSFFDQPATRFA